jgi:hypothetical protein
MTIWGAGGDALSLLIPPIVNESRLQVGGDDEKDDDDDQAMESVAAATWLWWRLDLTVGALSGFSLRVFPECLGFLHNLY